MQNFRERLRTLKTGLWVLRTSRMRSVRCVSLDGYRRSLHCLLFSHPKLATGRTVDRILDISCSHNTFRWVFHGQCFSVKMSQTSARSREFLILLSSFAVTIRHHRCSTANMAWDPGASDSVVRLVESQSGQGSRDAPGPSVPGRVRFAPSRGKPVWECSSSDEDVTTLAREEGRVDFPEVSEQLLNLSEWKLTAYGCFFREGNITVQEKRSIFYAVRDAEERYPPGRFFIQTGNLALVLALCKGRSNIFYMAFSHTSNLCVWLQGRFCLIFQVDAVRVELFRQGKSFLSP